MKVKVLLAGVLFLSILFTPFEVPAKDLVFGFEGGYFSPGNSIFKDVYGSGGLCYGINGTFFFSKALSIEAGFNMFSADGTIPGSEDDTSLKLNTLRFGLFYHFDMTKFRPKIGAGAVYAMVKEDNIFGNFSEAGTGFFAGAGFDYHLTGIFLTGLELLYHDAKIEGDFGDESVGGISLLLSLKIEI